MIKMKQNISGFTIVELMIALTVLSTILLLSTSVMVNIGALYSKGINSANLQNANRTLSSDISSALQFSGYNPFPCPIETGITCAASQNTIGSPPGPIVYSFCINTTRYSYILNRELGADSGSTPPNLNTPHVLWRDTMKNTSTCVPLDIKSNVVQSDANSVEGSGVPSKGYEMLPDHTRLTRFKVKESPIGSGVFKVDTWLAFGDTDLINAPDANGQTSCKGGVGGQFCGVSMLSNSVTRRLQ